MFWKHEYLPVKQCRVVDTLLRNELRQCWRVVLARGPGENAHREFLAAKLLSSKSRRQIMDTYMYANTTTLKEAGLAIGIRCSQRDGFVPTSACH